MARSCRWGLNATTALAVVVLALPLVNSDVAVVHGDVAEAAERVATSSTPEIDVVGFDATGGQLVAALDVPEAAAGERPPPYWLIFVGRTVSDTPREAELMKMLRRVVLPAAARRGARVVVAIASGATATLPKVAAMGDLAVSEDEDGGNPVLRKQLVVERVEDIVAELDATLRETKPASSSDWSGALTLAAQLRAQYSTRAKTVLVLVGDMLNAQPGCNLSAEDISPTGRDAVAAGCFPGGEPDLLGMTVGFAGAGVGRDLPAAKAVELEAYYRWLIPHVGGRVSCYAAVLIAPCVAGK